MARIPILAGNWKMNTTAQSARELADGIAGAGIDSTMGVEQVLCPPFVYIPLVTDAVRGTAIKVGAQDVFWEEKGAFTGEVSIAMLRDYCSHVIIGHSERRQYFGETDETVRRKLQAALSGGLIPIVCVGETGDERNAGRMHEVLKTQVHGAMDGLTLPPTVVIAYEPVWAIGTGVAATAQDANDAIGFIRGEIASLQGASTADSIRILYGGSVSPANAKELIDQPEVDGGLVGGASLVADSWTQMVRAIA
ncbi:MAG TPA: triose-phosphate isomerase [Dehalococcoidia bacterium]|nr:triose-phosphate isomerase [Dehalococcoidia bacterium]